MRRTGRPRRDPAHIRARRSNPGGSERRPRAFGRLPICPRSRPGRTTFGQPGSPRFDRTSGWRQTVGGRFQSPAQRHAPAPWPQPSACATQGETPAEGVCGSRGQSPRYRRCMRRRATTAAPAATAATAAAHWSSLLKVCCPTSNAGSTRPSPTPCARSWRSVCPPPPAPAVMGTDCRIRGRQPPDRARDLLPRRRRGPRPAPRPA